MGRLAARLPLVGLLAAFGCGGGSSSGKPNAGKPAPRTVVRNTGSDTMVNLAQMWAEEYRRISPNASVEVSGGGSGVGIRDLAQGIVDIANASREITASEKAQALKNTGKTPQEWIVGYDAIAIYVHRDNPVQEITFEQLAGIFGKGGTIERWSQLGAAAEKDRIIRASRMNNSGTYVYFREHVLAKQDFKLGALGMSGSKEVVELVGHTPGAIGYSGMGYKTAAVKFVSVAAKAGAPAYAPTFENVRDKKYPLARSLNMYTLGEPQGETRKYLDWILSPAGQAVVRQAGYIPVAAGQGQ
ncbi:MAG TPA: phosphate ABC transporter substrate-binding protein [Planctomycetota bacterium]|nr:phosphate ABC transporter substrate-binding protein [Planctomycetota bacterium]